METMDMDNLINLDIKGGEQQNCLIDLLPDLAPTADQQAEQAGQESYLTYPGYPPCI